MSILIPPGYEYIRLRTNSKLPIGKCPEGPHEHTSTCSWNVAPSLTIVEVLDILKNGGNYGLRIPKGKLVVDVDPRNGGSLDSLGFSVLGFPCVETPSGGFHIYGNYDRFIRLRTSIPTEMPGIDFKHHGGYVVGPGSTIDGRTYQYDMFFTMWREIDWPADFLARITLQNIASSNGPVNSEYWTVERLDNVLSQVDIHAFSDNESWFKLMCACHEATRGEGLEVFTKWSVGDANYCDHEHIIRSRWNSLVAGSNGAAGVGTLLHILAPHGVRHIGFDDTETLTPYALQAEESTKPKSFLEDMNDRFFVVQEDGKLRILEVHKADDLGTESWIRHSRRDFLEVCQSIYHYPPVEVVSTDAKGNEVTKRIPMAQRWIDAPNPGKRVYPKGLVFMPENSRSEINGALNMWRGFAFVPKRGSWNLLQELIEDVLCAGDLTSYEYVLNWLARAVQFPAEPALTALVFKGRKGCGKGSLGRSFVRLFGVHGKHVASKEAVSGRFNSHLQHCCAMFADEAFFAGDRAAAGMLQALITEPRLHYEAKGLTPFDGKNCIHMLMASDQEWVVPAGLDSERRYAIFEAAKTTRSWEFFVSLNKQLNEGGYESMLFDLLNRDISNFRVQQIPQTDALITQKLESMDFSEQWIYRLLDSENWNGCMRSVGTETMLAYDLLRNFTDFVGVRNRSPRALEVMMGVALKKYVPNAKRLRIAKPLSRTDNIPPRPWAYEMPELELAKREFIRVLGKDVFNEVD